jgi:hypothetical protein
MLGTCKATRSQELCRNLKAIIFVGIALSGAAETIQHGRVTKGPDVARTSLTLCKMAIGYAYGQELR